MSRADSIKTKGGVFSGILGNAAQHLNLSEYDFGQWQYFRVEGPCYEGSPVRVTTDEDSPRNLPQVIVALTPDVRVYYAADSHMKNGDKQIMQDLSVPCGAAFLATDTV